jgi:DNA invertase Pin-like site-specific DNA recombinase
MSKPRVYSYLRFSDPRQSTGNSAERQVEYARRWAAERSLVLDEALSMRDEGLSAYHQRHVSQGALGVFLAAISAGRIAPGSVLIVEGLDRLSRAEPLTAQGQLAQIVNAGITVVTASDGREYNRAGLKAQPMDLVYSLLVMIRAHEESDTKSKRVKASIRRACEKWIAGTYRGLVQNGKDPAWVRWTGTAWELVPEHVEAVRMVLRLFRAGEGSVRIMRELNAAGLKVAPKGGASSNLYRLIRLPALYGTKRLELDNEAYLLHNYYPALISEPEWAELQHQVADRSRRRGRGDIVGLITGMGRCYCGYCGASVSAQNIMGRKRKSDGKLNDGHRRLMCAAYSHAAGCPVAGSCSVVPIEKALLEFCSDQINLSALLQGDDRADTLRARLAGLRTNIAATETQIDRVTTAMIADDAPAPAAFARKARELEAKLIELDAEATATENELAALAATETPAMATTWAALAADALAMDHAARLQVRQLVHDTFARIEIYHMGLDPYADGPRTLGLQLFSQSGVTRMLVIDRRTGTLAADVRTTAPAMTAGTPAELLK